MRTLEDIQREITAIDDACNAEVKILSDKISNVKRQATKKRSPLEKEVTKLKRDADEKRIFAQTLEVCKKYGDDCQAVEKFAQEIIGQNYSFIIKLPEDSKDCWCSDGPWTDDSRVILLLAICANMGIPTHRIKEIFGSSGKHKGIDYPRCLTRERLIVTCCEVKNKKK
jgi:hypothetical protein